MAWRGAWRCSAAAQARGIGENAFDKTGDSKASTLLRSFSRIGYRIVAGSAVPDRHTSLSPSPANKGQDYVIPTSHIPGVH